MKLLWVGLLLSIISTSTQAQEAEPTQEVGVNVTGGYWVLKNGNQPNLLRAVLIPLNEDLYKSFGITDIGHFRAKPGSPGETFSQLYQAGSIYYHDSTFKPVTADQYFDLVSTYGSKLPFELKLDLLRRDGGDLLGRYDKTLGSVPLNFNPKTWIDTIEAGTADRSDDEIFSRKRTNSDNAVGSVGVCRHIHRYLAREQTALGFESYQISVNWRQSGDSGSHALTAFRDPETGKIYIQNYNDIIEIGGTSENSVRPIQEAVSQFLSGSTYTSVEQPMDGSSSHLYLTQTGALVMLGIDRASQLEVPKDLDILIDFERQNGYTGIFAKIPLNKRINRDAQNMDYIFFGSQDLSGNPSLINFTQGFIGFGSEEHYQWDPSKKQNSRWLKTVDNAANMGIQNSFRLQIPTLGQPSNKTEQDKSETFIFLNYKIGRDYSIQSLNTKNTLNMGGLLEFKWNDFISLNGSAFASDTSPPFNYLKPYVSLTRKLSKQTNLKFTVSEVSQLSITNLSSDRLGMQHQFFTGDVELFRVGKYGYIRSNNKLYVLPKGGWSAKTFLEFTKSLYKGKLATISVIGSGTYGANLKDSKDKWYSLKPYQTSRLGLEYSKQFKSVYGSLKIGAGIQQQNNTNTNTFDPIEMKNIHQYLENPYGTSSWFYIKLSNFR